MSDTPDRPHKSHTLTWALVILIGAPVFYFLTLPWLAIPAVNLHMSHSLLMRIYLKPAQAMPYCIPWHRRYDPYVSWCWYTAAPPTIDFIISSSDMKITYQGNLTIAPDGTLSRIPF